MRKASAAIILLLCLTVGLAGCARRAPSYDKPGFARNSGMEYAYLMAIDKLGWGEAGHILAVDLSQGVLLEDTASLEAALQAECDKRGITLLLADRDTLREQGHIIKSDLYDGDSHFENGALVTFDDEELTERKLVTRAGKWYGSLGAHGGTYTIQYKQGAWELDDGGVFWQA